MLRESILNYIWEGRCNLDIVSVTHLLFQYYYRIIFSLRRRWWWWWGRDIAVFFWINNRFLYIIESLMPWWVAPLPFRWRCTMHNYWLIDGTFISWPLLRWRLIWVFTVVLFHRIQATYVNESGSLLKVAVIRWRIDFNWFFLSRDLFVTSSFFACCLW